MGFPFLYTYIEFRMHSTLQTCSKMHCIGIKIAEVQRTACMNHAVDANEHQKQNISKVVDTCLPYTKTLDCFTSVNFTTHRLNTCIYVNTIQAALTLPYITYLLTFLSGLYMCIFFLHNANPRTTDVLNRMGRPRRSERNRTDGRGIGRGSRDVFP